MVEFSDIVNLDIIGRREGILSANPIKAVSFGTANFLPIPKKKVVFFGIDNQLDFLDYENAGENEWKPSLPIPGSCECIKNTCQWLWKNREEIMVCISSSNTNYPLQAFHFPWWRDKNGNCPDSFTVLNKKNMEDWRTFTPEWKDASWRYIDALGESTILPLHVLKGTVGHNLEPQYYNMMEYISAAHQTQHLIFERGEVPYAYFSGVFHSGFHKEVYKPVELIKWLNWADVVVIVGQRMFQSLVQMCEELENPSKIYFLQDCSSLIQTPFCKEDSEIELQRLKKEYGIHLVNSNEFLL